MRMLQIVTAASVVFSATAAFGQVRRRAFTVL